MVDEERIAEILAEWCARLGGEKELTPEDLIRSHPDLEEALREHFAAMDLIGRACPPPPELPAGTPRAVGDFRIIREIGRGGMGVVYEAEQASMERRVALKVLSPAMTSTAQATERFRREARAAGRIHHTSIVPIHAMGEDRGLFYYAMELVEGPPLDAVIAWMRDPSLGEGAVDRETVEHLLRTTPRDRDWLLRLAEMMSGVADALHAAHGAGIIHRDVKPANLLLDRDGKLKLVDFGLARLAGEGGSMTMTGQILGTPYYMSPEQATARKINVDHRSDVYSLGATLYECLTLRPPFTGDSIQEVCSQIASKEPTPPRKVDPGIPKDLETIVQKAMEKEPAKRYATAEEMARDLRRFAEGVPIRARRVGPVQRLWRRAMRQRVRVALVAAVLLLAVFGAVVALHSLRVDDARRVLEYSALCSRAESLIPRSSGLTALSAFEERMRPGETARDVYAQAIELDPDRTEAWFGRALAPGRTLEQRLEDLRAAGARGLPEPVRRLARLFLRRAAEDPLEEEEEALLAGSATAGSPKEAYFLAHLLASENRREEARLLLSGAIEEAEPGSALLYLALRSRAALRRDDGDFEGALEDLGAVRALGTNLEIQVSIAFCRRRLGQELRAEAVFREALKDAKASQSPLVWQRLCAECRRRKERPWQLRATEAALAAFPNACDLVLERVEAVKRPERLALCRRAVALDPLNPLAQRTLARVMAHNGLREESVAVFRRAIELDPDSAEVRSMLGRCLTDLGQLDEALTELDEAVRLNPRHGMAHKHRGCLLEMLGRFEEAIAAYGRAIRYRPTYPLVYHRRWMLLRRLGRAEQAQAETERATRLNHPGPGGCHQRAMAFCSLGRLEDALAEIEEAARRHVDVRFLPATRAAILGGLGRFEESLAAFEEVIREPPDHWEHKWRAFVLLEMARYAEALADFEVACGLWPRDEAHPGRAYTLACLGRTEEAAASLIPFDEFSPWSDSFLHWQIEALLMLNRPEDALALAEIEVIWFPATVERKVRCLRALGRGAEAVDLARTRIRSDPNPLTLLSYAWLCAVAGEKDRALEVIRGMKRPWSPTTSYERAAVHAVLGDSETALEWLTKAVDGGLRRVADAPADPDFLRLKDNLRYHRLREQMTRDR